MTEKKKPILTGQQRLVKDLLRSGAISHSSAEEAMLVIDRGNFFPRDALYAYADSPQSIGHGATISAPHMHAIALSCLAPKLVPGAKALDIGSGSGYLTACMAYLVGPTGRVIGIDHVDALVTKATANLRGCSATQELLDSGAITMATGDGRRGFPTEQPFDAIHVGAAAEQSVPPDLTDQLAPGGRLVCPVGPAAGRQTLLRLDRALDGSLSRRALMGVTFVPLV